METTNPFLASDHQAGGLCSTSTTSQISNSLNNISYLGSGFPPQNMREYNQFQLSNYSRNNDQYDSRQQKASGVFFESPSKYVSLKKHKSQYYSDNNTSTNSDSTSLNQKQPVFSSQPSSQNQRGKLQTIKEWFEQLSLEEKSIALTIVDKPLVNLVFEMYQMYREYRYGGKFTNTHYPSENAQPWIRVKPVKNYNYSEYLKKVFQAEEQLISSIRLIDLNQRSSLKLNELTQNSSSNSNDFNKVKFSANQLQKSRSKKAADGSQRNERRRLIDNYNALTLDPEIYHNNQFFFELMKMVHNNNGLFLKEEYQLVNDTKYLENSVFFKEFRREDPTAYCETTKDQSLLEMPSKFYTFKPQKDIEEPKGGLSLGTCLYFIFEKAINAQYYDYAGRISLQQASYFFLEPEFNVFFYDQRLTKFWLESRTEERERIIKKMEEIEQELLKREHLRTYKCPDIIEQSSEQDDDDDYQDEYGRKDSQFDDYEDYDHTQGRNSSSMYHYSSDLYRNNDDLEKQKKRTLYEDEERDGYRPLADSSTPLPFTKLKKPKEYLDNALMNQNIFMKQKMKILVDSRRVLNEHQVFMFIKSLSTHLNLEKLSTRDKSHELPKEFYNMLVDEYQKSMYQDLIEYDEKNTKGKKDTNNSQQTVVGKEQSVQDSNTNSNTLKPQNTKKKNKKKKNKNKANQQQQQETNQSQNAKSNEQVQKQVPQYISSEQQNLEIVYGIMKKQEESEDTLEEMFNKQRKLMFERATESEDPFQTYLVREQQRIQERTGLLSGKVHEEKYPEEIFDYQPPVLPSATQPPQQQTAAQQQKKKKRKKQKKNKNKKPVAESQTYNSKIQNTDNEEEEDKPEIAELEIEQIQITLDQEEEKLEEAFKNEAVSLETRKINNFVSDSMIEEQKVNVEIEMMPIIQKIDEVEDFEEETKSFTENITADICKKVIFAVEEKPHPQNENHGKKRKQNNQKKNKKANNKHRNQNSNNQQIEQTPKNSVDHQDQDMQENQDNPQSNISEPEKIQEESFQSPESTKNKRVIFRISREDDDDNVKIPKRGSSRGSSVGTEDIIHQNTISSLGELFPSEYKNPSDDTKIKIIEITNSNSSSISPQKQEGSKNSQQISNNKPQTKQQNFQNTQQLESLTNQNKARKTQQQNYKKNDNYYQTYEPKTTYINKNSEFKAQQQNQDTKKQSPQVPNKKPKAKKPQNKQLQPAHFDSYESMFKNTYYQESQEQKTEKFAKASNEKELKQVQQSQDAFPIKLIVEDKVSEVQINLELKKQESPKNDCIKESTQKQEDKIAQKSTIQSQEQSTSLEQNSLNQSQTSSNNHKRKKKNIQEKGISVNPDLLQQNQPKKPQNNSHQSNQLQLPNQSLPHAHSQKKTKNKVLIKQNQQQQQLHGIPLEQRSQTPIIEQTSELLSQTNGDHHRHHPHQNKKGHPKQNKNHKKKPSHATNTHNQQNNLDSMIAFDKQHMNPQAQNPYYSQPFIPQMIHPQFIFGQQNQQMPFMQQQSFMPQQYFMPQQPQIFNQQFMYSPPTKVQSTQQTQTEVQVADDKQKTEGKTEIQQEANSQDKLNSNPQTALKNETQQQNIQTMINQIQNFNIQVLQLPINPMVNPFQLTNQMPFQNMLDPHTMSMPQQPLNNPMPSQHQFHHQNSTPLFNSQTPPPVFSPINYQQHHLSPYQSYQQTPQQQHNLPFHNFFQPSFNFPMMQNNYYSGQFNQNQFFNNSFSQQQIDDKNVSHQTIDEYNTQDYEDKFYQKLDQEIYKLQYKQKLKLSLTEIERQQAFKCIEYQVKLTFQGKISLLILSEYVNVKVQMYGSMATGLAIDSSDMDVLVSGVFQGDGQIDRYQLIEQMKKLHKQLNQLSCLESNSIIETASVPVIKIVNSIVYHLKILDLQKIRDQNNKGEPSSLIDEDMKHLKIDITFNDQEGDNNLNYGMYFAQPVHMGIKCCEFIKMKLNEYGQLEPLTLLLKKFLALRDLNSPFLGGLSSYGLILLIIAFINQNLPQMYNPDDSLSAARIFVQFLYYYGKFFDTKLNMINEFQQIIPHLNFSSILIILDPLNPSNNIGKSTYNFDQIKNEFSLAYDKLMFKFEEYSELQQELHQSQENSIDEVPKISETDMQQQPSSSNLNSSDQKVEKKKFSILDNILFDSETTDKSII